MQWEPSGLPFYRCAKSTLGGRIKKKLTEKTNWFKKKSSDGQGPRFGGLNANGKPDVKPTKWAEQKVGYGGINAMESKKRNRSGNLKENNGEGTNGKQACKSPPRNVKAGRVEKAKPKAKPEVKTVIFIPQTANSKLAKMLREEEPTLERMTGYRIKYVEKVGTSIGGILCKSDHWAGRLCGREACLLCYTKQVTGENLRQSCTKRNIVYETWCQTCKVESEKEAEAKGRDPKKIKLYKYIGESAKSAFERGFEHQNDKRTLQIRSHMLKHAVDRHEEARPEDIEFRMKVLQYPRSAFERQVSESIKIQRNTRHHILNSKGEYNRCALPRLGLKIGTKEYSKAKESEDMEEEKERNIEEKIRMMRKQAGKSAQRRKVKPSTKEKENRRGQPIRGIQKDHQVWDS